jgi:hypothetical protein
MMSVGNNLGARRKPSAVSGSLTSSINFIFARPGDGKRDGEEPVILLRAADEFIFPARLALDIQNAALGGFDVDASRATELLS